MSCTHLSRCYFGLTLCFRPILSQVVMCWACRCKCAVPDGRTPGRWCCPTVMVAERRVDLFAERNINIQQSIRSRWHRYSTNLCVYCLFFTISNSLKAIYSKSLHRISLRPVCDTVIGSKWKWIFLNYLQGKQTYYVYTKTESREHELHVGCWASL